MWKKSKIKIAWIKHVQITILFLGKNVMCMHMGIKFKLPRAKYILVHVLRRDICGTLVFCGLDRVCL